MVVAPGVAHTMLATVLPTTKQEEYRYSKMTYMLRRMYHLLAVPFL